MMNRRQVVLADDHVLVLDAIEKLIEGDCDVVGRASDGERLLSEVTRLRPDVVVLDVTMPGLNGLEAARCLKRIAPDTRIVFLTMNDDLDVAAEAFRAGASAYVLKCSAASELLAAIRDVSSHRSYGSPRIAEGLADAMARPAPALDSEPSLTGRQREVITLLANGQSMKQVAAILHIAPRTVAFHKYRVMEALHLRTSADLVQFAVKHHIV